MLKRQKGMQWLFVVAFGLVLTSCGGWQPGGAGPEGDKQIQPKDPAATLPSSLHGAGSGMRWWFEEPDGFGPYSGVSYENAGCGHCHVSTCDECHADAAGLEPAVEPDSCKKCHGRIQTETQLELSDVHFKAGMVCSNCHSADEMHGDGIQYNSMFSPGAMDTKCENCHTDLADCAEHAKHGSQFGCDACHVGTVVTCYNCHFETLLKSQQKKAAGAFKGYILLLNDENGKLRAGSYQTVVYEDKTFVAFGPYHGHTVTSQGRTCKDCHMSERMLELRDTDKVVMTQWDADKGKVTHTTGVIPFVPDKLEFEFVTLKGEGWAPLTKKTGQSQYKFCTPLTDNQLELLGATCRQQPGS